LGTKSEAVAKKADRTAYDVWYIAAEPKPNRRTCRIWNRMVTWPHYPRRKFRRFCCSLLCCGWTIGLHPTAKVSEEVNRKCHPRNIVVQLPHIPHTPTLSTTVLSVTDR